MVFHFKHRCFIRSYHRGIEHKIRDEALTDIGCDFIESPHDKIRLRVAGFEGFFAVERELTSSDT